MGRAPCCEKVGLKRGKWTAEEDELLTKYIQANGEGSWRSLPKNAGLLRCGKSCRLRWINYLRADIKRGNISAEEEDLIVKLHTTFGNRWSLIASRLPGRTDNEIKNYWNSHLSRKIYSFRRATNMDTTLPGLTDAPKVVIPPKPKPRGGRTSRRAMKKNKFYTQKGNQKPKQIALQHNEEASIPPPPTPSLASEVNLCSIIDLLDDFMVLDLDLDHTNNMVDKEEEPSFNVNKEKKGLEFEVQCPMYEQENNDMLLGPYDDKVEDVINVGGGGPLTFDDINNDSFMLQECGVLTSNQESESNNNGNNNNDNNDNKSSIVGEESEPKKMGMSGQDHQGESNSVNNLCSIGESGDWYLGYLDDCWDWESVMDLNNDGSIDESAGCNWKQRENLLAWLWEDDDCERECMKLGEMDAEKQNDMVAWFLS